MSEMVLIVPVIALTGIVLLGILAVFRKYLLLRDQLDREFLAAQSGADRVPHAETKNRSPVIPERPTGTRRIAA
jgi:hypothetical protein